MNDFQKMKKVYDEIDTLIKEKRKKWDPEFQAWHSKAKRTLMKIFGNESYEVKSFDETSFTLGIWGFNTPDSDFIAACANDLKRIKAVFMTYLDELQEEVTEEKTGNIVGNETHYDYSKVFIVHGHNGEIKEAVARLIENQGIGAIILNEQVNQGLTIIEKFEKYSNVGAAVCLFTADDMGNAKTADVAMSRARQNVVFETGYFIGKLGRERIVIIADKEVEIPSDLQGVVYSDSKYWHYEILKELNAIGYSIDMNKLLR